MLGVGRDREHHEFPKIEASRALKPFENPGGRTDEPEIDVLGSAGSLDAELHNETALDHRAVPELADDAREKAVEDKKLAPTRKVDAAYRCGAKPILKDLLERGGGSVAVHAALLRARIAFTSSLSMSARVRACRTAASMSSGDTCASMQSRSVLRAVVTGTAPISTRSFVATSP